MGSPIAPSAVPWTCQRLPVGQVLGDGTPSSNTLALASVVTLPATQKGSVAQLNLTSPQAQSHPLHVGLYRDEKRAAHVTAVSAIVNNPAVSRGRHAQVAWDPQRHILTIADLGSSHGTYVASPHWGQRHELRNEGLAIYVGATSPRTLIEVSTRERKFLEIFVGTEPPTLTDRHIYGVYHSSDDPSLAKGHQIILDAFLHGAATIGSEATPALLDGRYDDGYFDLLADEARALGMGVIPLVTNATHDVMQGLMLLKSCVTVDGMIDGTMIDQEIQCLDNDILDLREQLQRPAEQRLYLPPERMPARLQRRLDYCELMRHVVGQASDSMRSVGYSMDVWAAAYRRGMAAVDLEMCTRIVQHRPDIVIVGALHARNLHGLPGYTVQDLALGEPHEPVLRAHYADSTPRPFLKALHAFAAERVWKAADIAYRALAQQVHAELGKSIASSKTLAVLDRAIVLEPQLLSLVLRARYTDDPPVRSYLYPEADIAVFKLAVDEAHHRVSTAIRRAHAASTILGRVRELWRKRHEAGNA